MSAIAKQIQSIKLAVLTKRESFTFMGHNTQLKPGVAIFSTMNPIYLNRVELTENIKSCFRTIAVTMPEHEAILEIMLFGLKFIKPTEMALKIANVFDHLSIQLSRSVQYDFGLRAMKVMVGAIGKVKGQFSNEMEVVARALYEGFWFKLAEADRLAFEKIVDDTFHYKPAKSASPMAETLTSMLDCPQTGIIVFGPISTKSTLIRSYCSSFSDAVVEIFNPNAV
jgi:dynein heavy chain